MKSAHMIGKALITAFIFLLPFISTSYATVDYARQTGNACSVCHIDPSGGGPLTRAGIIVLIVALWRWW